MSTAIQIDSRREVLSDQPTSGCCIDRLSWHRFSGLEQRRDPDCNNEFQKSGIQAVFPRRVRGMRGAIARIILLLAMASAVPAQQDVPEPKKVLTPEQQTYQRELKTMRDESDRLRSKAKQAFDSEMEREKKGECPDAKSTLQINVCLDREKKTTTDNYRAYTDAIRAMLGLKEPVLPGIALPQRGPSGPILTPNTLVGGVDTTC